MEHSSSRYISDVRCASRDLVRELGFMSRTIAGTDLSASAVHAIIETGAHSKLSAKMIAEKLCLEKSTVSRLIKSLVEKGLLREVRSRTDSRMKYLHLTERGERTLGEITRFGEEQVSGAIAKLDHSSQNAILAGLQSYSQALKSTRTRGNGSVDRKKIPVEQGYAAGIIGRVVLMHASYYSRENGFGEVFEAKVAQGMAEFIPRLNQSCNQIWRACDKDKILGSIAIDGELMGENRGQLRWFIVDDELRGTGVGRRLIKRAVKFCDEQGFDETHLWTLKSLGAARKLYEDHGFELADEFYGEQWGPRVLEQKYIRVKR
jgi:DNA-binding MarR family transcriptional regulator/GNAT superfamily N-acetyltransferase